MTEEEAKGKWCPLARMPLSATVSANRYTDSVPATGSLCIGSACMAWRQNPHDQTMSKPKTGYCGAFGKP